MGALEGSGKGSRSFEGGKRGEEEKDPGALRGE